jgi:hypothetical protein
MERNYHILCQSKISECEQNGIHTREFLQQFVLENVDIRPLLRLLEVL